MGWYKKSKIAKPCSSEFHNAIWKKAVITNSLGTTIYKIKLIEESFVRLTIDGIYESSQDYSGHWKDSA